jgi:hypothetical protein
MTGGLQDKKISLFTVLVTYAYRMHIQDGGMHAAFDQNKSIYFENQGRYGTIVKEVYISF